MVRPLVHRRLVLHTMVPGAGIVRGLVHRAAVVRLGCGVVVRLRRRMVGRPGRIPVVRRPVAGVVPGRAMRRHAHVVHMRRVMPVPAVPGSRPPVRHKAGRRDGCYGENGSTRSGVTIHWAPVIITENRETIRIVTGIGPGDRGTHMRPAHRD